MIVHSQPKVRKFFFFKDPATTEIYPLSLHDALPISAQQLHLGRRRHLADLVEEEGPAPRRREQPLLVAHRARERPLHRSEEHTSELQSLAYLVCRLLLEKKNVDLAHAIHS